MLILRKPWDSQPQEAVEVDRGNPLTRGLVAAVNFATLSENSRGFPLSPSVYSADVTTAGRAFYVSGTSVYIDDSRLTTGITKSAGTVFALFAPDDMSSTSQYIFGARPDYGGGGDRYYLRVNSGAYQFGWASTANLSTGKSFVRYKPTPVAMSWETASLCKAYFEGVSVAQSTLTATTDPTQATIGSFPGGIGGFTGVGRHLLLATWNRALSAEEHANLAANPWQLFAPRSIWVPVSTASGTSYTITPSGGVVLGGTSVDIKGKVLDVSGGVTLAGTGSMAFTSGGTTYTITPSGGVTMGGSATYIQSKTFTPSGGITLGGTSDMVKTKIIAPTDGVILGGTGSMTSNTVVVTGTVGERTKVGAGT